MAMKSKPELAFYEAVIAGDAEGVAACLAANPELITWQDVDMLGVPDETALHLNTRYLARGDREKAYAVFDVLMEARPDVNARQRSGWTPLMHAAGNSDLRMMARLLSAGADPYLVNNDGGNALMCAAQKGSIECVHLLLSRGVPVDARDNGGQTALFKARYAGDAAPDMIRYLIEQGANPNIFDNAGRSPAQAAFDQKYEDIAESYSKIWAKVTVAKKRDAAVLNNGLPHPLTVGKPLRLKS